MPPEQRTNLRGRRVDDIVLHERLAIIDERLSNLCDVLLDNGQPGELSKLHTRINTVDSTLQELIGWRRWVHGVAAGVSAIMTALGGMVLWMWERFHTTRP